MDFQELVEKTGFGLAVVIFEEELPPEFWEKLTFLEWADIYKAAFEAPPPHGDKLEEGALTKMKELGTFEDWASVDYKSLTFETLSRMEELATTFGYWLKYYNKISLDPVLKDDPVWKKRRERALTNMQNLAISNQ